MNIQHILATKGAHVTTIHPEQTIRGSIGNIKPLFPWPPQRLPPLGCPPRHQTPPSPRAGRLAVCPVSRPPAGTADTPALPGAG